MFFLSAAVDSLVVCGSLLAQAEEPARELTLWQQIISSPILLFAGPMMLFYVFFLLPEKRRKAEEGARLSAIQKNDRIVTIGGIHGVVSAIVDDETLMIRLDENGTNKMKIDRKAVARIVAETNAPAAPKT